MRVNTGESMRRMDYDDNGLLTLMHRSGSGARNDFWG